MMKHIWVLLHACAAAELVRKGSARISEMGERQVAELSGTGAVGPGPPVKMVFMIAGQGTWGTTMESQRSKLNDLYNSKVSHIVAKISELMATEEGIAADTFELYVGYDGDGTYDSPPVTLFFMKVVKAVAEMCKGIEGKTCTLRLVECQNPKYMHPMRDLVNLYGNAIATQFELTELSEAASAAYGSEENVYITFGPEFPKEWTPIKDVKMLKLLDLRGQVFVTNYVETEEAKEKGMFGGFLKDKAVASTLAWERYLKKTGLGEEAHVFFVVAYDDSTAKKGFAALIQNKKPKDGDFYYGSNCWQTATHIKTHCSAGSTESACAFGNSVQNLFETAHVGTELETLFDEDLKDLKVIFATKKLELNKAEFAYQYQANAAAVIAAEGVDNWQKYTQGERTI